MNVYTIQYNVSGSLDGITASPAFSTLSNDASYHAPEVDQIYEFSVTNLGLIDVGFTNNSRAIGNRFLTFLWISGPSVGSTTASIDVVDDQNDLPSASMEQVASLDGIASLYLSPAMLIPQGSKLRVNGMTGTAVDPIVVRFSVVPLETLEEIAQAQGALRC